jgi:hypothetical protein
MEWRIAKLQLRYLAHEMRIAPERVSRFPHTMMLRAEIISDKRRPSGRGAHKYQETILRAAKACNIMDMEQLLKVSSNKLEFNKFMEEGARQYFLQNWNDKEDQLKARRREYELTRQENACIVAWARNYILHQARVEYGDDLEGGEEEESERAESVDEGSEEENWEVGEGHRGIFEDEEAVDRGSRIVEFIEDSHYGRGGEGYDMRMGGLWDEHDEFSGRGAVTQSREDHQVWCANEAEEEPQQVVDAIGGLSYAVSNGGEEETRVVMGENSIDDIRDAGEFLEFIEAWIRDETFSRQQILASSNPGPIQNHVTRMEGSGFLQMEIHQRIVMPNLNGIEVTKGMEELTQRDTGQQHLRWMNTLAIGDEESGDSHAKRRKSRKHEWQRNQRRQKARLRAEERVVGRMEDEGQE